MASSNLTADRLRELLHYDPESGQFTRLVSTAPNAMRGRVAGTTGLGGYVRVHVDRKEYKAHRLAWLYMTGEWPGPILDHIDCNPSNNRFANLRESDYFKNGGNRAGARKGNVCGQLGVSYLAPSGDYAARLCVNRKQVFYRRCKTLAEAIAARKEAEKIHRGSWY